MPGGSRDTTLFLVGKGLDPSTAAYPLGLSSVFSAAVVSAPSQGPCGRADTVAGYFGPWGDEVRNLFCHSRTPNRQVAEASFARPHIAGGSSA